MPLHIEGISVRKRVVSARQCRGSNAVDGDVLMQASVGWLVERTMMRDKEAARSCGVGVFGGRIAERQVKIGYTGLDAGGQCGECFFIVTAGFEEEAELFRQGETFEEHPAEEQSSGHPHLSTLGRIHTTINAARA